MKADISPRDILLSLVLLTRLPIPALPDSSFARQAQAVWAFPAVGMIVGGIAATIVVLAQWIGLSPAICAGLALLTMVCVTGAMHEDGLADTVDGFWGGFTPERRLEIMKDSHIGTYGVLALVLSLGLRWTALSALIAAGNVLSVVAVAALSRAMMPVLMLSLPNARNTGLAHRVGTPSRYPTGIALCCAALLAWAALGLVPATLCLLISAGAVWALHCLARAKVGGRTGDVLGATQQITEILCLLALTAISA